jgi:hypothetical protein
MAIRARRHHLSVLLLCAGPILVHGPATAQAPTRTSIVPASLLAAEWQAMDRYAAALAAYTTSCEELLEADRLPADRLRHCLTTLRELERGFGPASAAAGRVATVLRTAGRWTPALDAAFQEQAPRLGVPSAFAEQVRRDGGWRAAYEQRLRALADGRAAFAADARDLEDRIAAQRPPGGPAPGDVRGPAAAHAVKKRVKIIYDDLRAMTCAVIGESCFYTR